MSPDTVQALVDLALIGGAIYVAYRLFRRWSRRRAEFRGRYSSSTTYRRPPKPKR